MQNARWILLYAICAWPVLVEAAGVWTNEPDGSAVVLDHPFNTIVGPGMSNPYNAGSIVTDLSSPISPPNVHKDSISAGQTTGGTELHWFSPTAYNEMYFGMMWRTNPEFFGRTVANKMWFMRGPTTNHFFGMNGCPGQGQANCYIEFGHNTGNLDNSHACAFDLGLVCHANVGDATVIRGQWTKLESYMKKSTTATSRDGIVRWWINGVLVGNYTNLNVSPLGINEWVWSETWDGFVNPPPTVEWAHYLDHLHISIPNCPPGGCVPSGGGTTPPSPTPPPPSPTPPSPTPPPPSGTPGTVSDLAVVPLSSTTARMTFTQQNDGTGVPAKYDNRLAVSPISWGAASSVTVGPCSSPFAPSGIIGSQVICDLSGLIPGQAYQLQNVAFRGTMNAGATYGGLSNIASFTMPSSNVPAITNFTPATGQSGTSITIAGTNFGATVGANTVKVNGQTCTVTAASSTSLTVTVPGGVTTGKISVQTDQGIVFSETNFTVGGDSNSCGCS